MDDNDTCSEVQFTSILHSMKILPGSMGHPIFKSNQGHKSRPHPFEKSQLVILRMSVSDWENPLLAHNYHNNVLFYILWNVLVYFIILLYFII